MPRRRVSKATWNERIKLIATSLNAVGLAVVGFGVLGPYFSAARRPLDVQSAVCAVKFAALHVTAHLLLRGLED